MKEKNFVNKKYAKKIVMYMLLLISICSSILFFVKFLTNVSVGAENPTVSIEGNLEKYINFKISDEDKGTLVQYDVKTGIEQESDGYSPIRESELTVSLNQIDGKYPYSVKVIAKSTEVTNGKTENIQEDYQYDETTGTVTIKASNVNENGGAINSEETNQDARDEYIIIGYYDTYVEEAEERELDIKVALNAVLFKENTDISQENEFKGKVKDNIGELSSISYDAVNISNGYIKSNIINGTSYNTTYVETQNITISKKEAQEKIRISENNTIIKTTQDQNGEEITEELGNNGNLVYKSTKIKKDNMVKILGEDGVIEILDVNGKVIATIDKNTEFGEDGTVEINYENELETIIIKTSAIQNEGILKIENAKEIKSTMLEVDVAIKTVSTLTGINEEIIEAEETEEAIKNEKELYANSYENIIKIKDAQTNVTMEVSNAEWTNKQQNEVTFDIYVNSNTINDNMLKNPSIRIELPSQVEKVILGNSSAVYANGLELQTPYLETNENGNTVIVTNLLGTQTRYDENTLGLVTDVKISATIILKKDIEDTVGNVNLTFTNQYTLNGEAEVQTKSNELQIKSYKEESTQVKGESITSYTSATNVGATAEELKGLTLEVAPVKGETVIADGDIVYEGEFIKYNIKVTNTTDKKIDNIKVVGTIPEGTIYGELEADYYTSTGKYQYNYDDTVTEKKIEIGSLEAGKSVTKFYEVKVNDLIEGQDEQQIKTNIKTYIGETQTASYELENVIKQAEVKIFLGAFLGTTKDQWTYSLSLSSDETKDVTVKLKKPEEYSLEYIVIDGEGIKLGLDEILEKSEDNMITLKVQTNNTYLLGGYLTRSESTQITESSEVELTAVASAELNNVTYQSNENRILFGYENVSISMTSENEGEEVKYEDEINYEITIRNTGKSNLQNSSYSYMGINVTDYLPEDIELVSITYENWEEQIEIDEENASYLPTGEFNKTETVIDDIGTLIDEEENRLPEVDLYLTIPYGESVSIKIKTTAGFVFEKTKIENSATVSGDGIESKTSNIITHTILPYNYVEDEDIEDPNNPSNPDEPSNPDDSDNSNTPNSPSDSDEKYSVSGVAWLDENEDGKRQTSEQLLSGITVMLVDTNNSSAIKAKQVTDTKGAYSFSELDNGKYIVAFNYDTDTYSLTEYQKNGIATSVNSDAADKEINLLGTQTKVGLTDIISLDASIQNIDIGLIKNKICDLKLDKYISKVIVKTASGTKEQTYDNTQLAKVEIKSKEIQGATVVVTYKIVVTNEGELPTSVSKVTDYLPDGLEFSSELNKNWNITKSGELTNTSISNQKIEPGKSIEVELILTKTMTQNATGTFTNIAEIGEISNSLGTKDTDSTPGNKAENEDDYSKADIIISVSTGAVFYISIGILVIIIVGIVIFLMFKYGILKIRKIFLFGTILVVTFIPGINNVDAVASVAPSTAHFTWNSDHKTVNGVNYWNNYGSMYFEGNESTTGDAYCIQPGVGVAPDNSTYQFNEYGKQAYVSTNSNAISDSISFTLKKNNDLIEMQTIEENRLLLGPFKFYCSEDIYMYDISVYGTNKENIGYTILDKNLNHITYSDGTSGYLSGTGEFTFYLEVYAGQCKNGIANITLSATKAALITTNTTVYRKAKYVYSSTTQDVETINVFKVEDESSLNNKFIYGQKNIKWTNINGALEMIKQDADADEAIDLELGDLTYDGKLNSSDVDHISSYLKGTYEFDDEDKLRADVNEDGTIDDNDIIALQNKIIKIEESKLEGVEFYVKNSSEKYVKQDSKGNISYVASKNNATLFETDENGKIYIENLTPGTYTMTEIYNPNYGYLSDARGTVTIGVGQVLTYTLENTKQTGNLQIIKKDKDSGVVLDGVKFKIKDSNGKYIVPIDSDNEDKYKREDVTGTIKLIDMTTVDNVDEATTFITDENGKIEIINMLCGDYTLEEVDVGNHFGYEIDDNYISWNNGTSEGKGASMPITVKRQSSTQADVDQDSSTIRYANVLNVYNKQKYIKLSGYAWEDIIDTNKQSYKNYLYDENAADKRLQYVAVTLVDEDGNELQATMTDENGQYVFEKVEISRIDDGGYIKFTYNGFSYQTVDVNCINENGEKVENGNTAKEYEEKSNGQIVDSRAEFNSKFAKIENNTAYSENENYPSSLTYNSDDYTSTLNLETSGTAKYGYKGQNYPIRTSSNEDIYFIIARTETNTETDISKDYRLFGQNKTIQQLLEAGVDEIENINLGLYEREQPDIALLKDLYNVKISVNGYNHIYEYGSRFNHLANNLNDEEAAFNAGVQFQSGKQEDYNNISYSRAIYTSDYEYKNEQDANKELKVYATYKLVIKNESSNLMVRVNEIVDYYYEAFTFESIGTGIDTEGKTTGNVNYTNDDTNKKLYINTDAKISGSAQGNNKTEIYVQFSITKDKLGQFLHESIGDNKTYKSTNNLENMAEIRSYSVFDTDGSIYAGIDKDSNPENADLNKVREGKREDDTSLAPGFVIEVKNARKLTGTVFLDNSVFEEGNSNDTHTGQARNGNGAYESSEEKTISGVKVSLYKADTTCFTVGSDGITYITGNPSGKTKYLDKDGNAIENATATDSSGRYEIIDFVPGDYIIVYTWGNQTYIAGDTNSPINVNDYKGTIYRYQERVECKDWYRDYPSSDKWRIYRYSDAMDDYTLRQKIDNDSNVNTMNSMTPIMRFGMEYTDDIRDGYLTGTTSGNNNLQFEISYVDFGITERARQELDIDKKVKSIKITLANGQTLVDGEVEEGENGTLKLNYDQNIVSGMAASEKTVSKNGYLKAEMDSELLQGSTLEIQYVISLTNNSELDYDNKEYYLYGDMTNLTDDDIIKYAPDGVYDYLDSSMILAEDEDTKWEIKTITNYNEIVSEPTITEEYLYKYSSITTDSDGNTIEYTGYENFKEQYKVEDWSMETITESRKKRLADKTILYYSGDIIEVTPGDTAELATLTASKVLANSDAIELDNDVEIADVTRTTDTGREVTVTSLYDKAETITVTTNTGENKDYIPIISIVISSFIILGTGIVFIKKKILG